MSLFIKDQAELLNATIENMKTRFRNELRCISFDWDSGYQHPSRTAGDIVYEGWIILDKIPLDISAFCTRDYDALREFAEKIVKDNAQFCRYVPEKTESECLDYIHVNVFDFEEQLEELKRIDKLLCRENSSY